MTQTAFRARLLRFDGDPAQSDDALAYDEDGLLIVENGRVVPGGAPAGRPPRPPSRARHGARREPT